MKKTITVISTSPDFTADLGQRIGQAITAGTVIAATGDLGAGKTLFAAGLGRGLGVEEPITSPTFIFFNDYQGRLPFCHLDAYRLEGLEAEELEFIGLDDCFRRDKVLLCEWPQFVTDWLPSDTVALEIRKNGEYSRELRFEFDEEKQEWLYEVLSH